MSKSILTIHKEILKKEYAKSPLGILERKIREFYEEIVRSGTQLPEDISKKINEIRTKNEKDQEEYVEYSLKRDRENVDNLLFESMTKEWELLNNYKNTMHKDDK